MTLPITNWHTVGELNDLVNALDYEVQQIGKAAGCASANIAWVTGPNAADAATWLGDYNAAVANWNTVVTQARALVSATPQAAWSITPGETLFQQLVEAFGPFDDLDRRTRYTGADSIGFPASCVPSYPNEPQPQSPDLVLDAYKVASAVTAPIDNALAFFQTPGGMLLTGLGIVGGVALVIFLVRR